MDRMNRTMTKETRSTFLRAGVPEDALQRWEAAPRAATNLVEGQLLMEGPIVGSETDEILRAMGFEMQVSPESFRAGLANMEPGTRVTLKIDSPGGDVFAAGNIVSEMAAWEGGIDAVVSGMAASGAGYIALSADTTRMGSDISAIMMHSAWGVVIGNARDLRDQAAMLERVDEAQARVLARAGDMNEDEARAALAAETWWVGQDAVEAGLADSVLAGEKDDKRMEGDHDDKANAAAVRRSTVLQRRALAMIRGAYA